jgi:hypothetical protein
MRDGDWIKLDLKLDWAPILFKKHNIFFYKIWKTDVKTKPEVPFFKKN